VGYADFYHLSKKVVIVTLIISCVTGPIFLIFAQNVANILPFIFLNRNGDIEIRFGTLLWANERIYPHFAVKLVAMATFLEESEKEVQFDHIHAMTYHFVKKNCANQFNRS